MTPGIPLPDPLAQPAPPGLLWVLLQLTFLLHVLAMNLVLGGSLLALQLRLERGTRAAAERARLLRFFERVLPIAIAATITFGVAPLLFVQALYGRVFFVSSIVMAWYWLSIVPLLIVAYSAAYWLALRSGASVRPGRWLGGLLAVTVATVAFLQVTNASRGLRVETLLRAIHRDRRGLTLNLDDPSFWPRYLHVLLGALAVAALAVALYGAWRRGRDASFAAWAVRRGTTVFAVATVANVFVGLLFLIALPKPVLIRLVGGDARAMGLLATGILLAVALAGASLLALGARELARATWTLGALTLLTLLDMLLLREELRRISLREAGFVPPAWVASQWGPFAVFAACLVGGTLTIVWMVRALARGRAPAGPAAALLVASALGLRWLPLP